MKGFEAVFNFKKGIAPKSAKSVKILRGDECILVYDDKDVCVGVVWKHYESRDSLANGKAEIRFFDEYGMYYGFWHRVRPFGDDPLPFDRLQQIINTQGKYTYQATAPQKSVKRQKRLE